MNLILVDETILVVVFRITSLNFKKHILKKTKEWSTSKV